MRAAVLTVVKSAGIAALYASAALLLCATADWCLSEPFVAHHGGYSSGAWRAFDSYMVLLFRAMTAVAAWLAARSYRPAWSIGGALTGTAAALFLGVADWWGSHISGRAPPSIWSAFLPACFIGVVFGVLGTVSARRLQAQRGAPPNGGPAEPVGNPDAGGAPPSVS
jgi:hypothetical protein